MTSFQKTLQDIHFVPKKQIFNQKKSFFTLFKLHTTKTLHGNI